MCKHKDFCFLERDYLITVQRAPKTLRYLRYKDNRKKMHCFTTLLVTIMENYFLAILLVYIKNNSIHVYIQKMLFT